MRLVLFGLGVVVATFGTGCGSLLYNCKANDTQCKEKVAALDRATAEIAIDATAAAVEATASAVSAPAHSEQKEPPPPPPAGPAAAAIATPAPTPQVSSTPSTTAPSTDGAASTFEPNVTSRELHVALHFARMCRGNSAGAVSGQVSIEEGGVVRVTRLVGPGVKDAAVLACVKSRIETATVPTFRGPPHTASLVFDVDPDDDLPTPKEAEAPVSPKK